ncbi:MAG: hypothetical protein RL689_1340 [Planctomycetota bacterium]
MSTTYIDRGSAGRRTTTARAVAVTLGVIAAGVLLIDLPGLGLPEATAPSLDAGATPEAAAPQAVGRPDIDFAGIAQRLSMVGNKPSVPKVDVPTEVATTQPATPAAPAEEARYLGVVAMGSARMALVVKDSKQRFVKVGDQLGELTVRDIRDESITLEGPGGRSVIDLAPKGADVVTQAAGATGGSGNPAAAFAGNPAAAAMAARTAAMRAQPGAPKVTPPRPAPQMPGNFQATPMSNFPHIQADPARRQRFAELQAKLRSSGEYKSQVDIDEAAAKLTEEEFQNEALQKGIK